ncbi:hypothetical protein [Pseudonocardia pini]|uniref:hypothetical protein n=1 Tax=Pseudonocardia pini TaxID=2758030 RepID=UPI0015F0B10C|nr:hypothetical protein [Pseudonocardia pini]
MIPPYGRLHLPILDPPQPVFRFDTLARPVLALLGVRPATCGIRVDDGLLDVRFGRWRVRTPIANVVSAAESGPFAAWRALGPRLSLADRGLTFGSSVRGGVCLTFHDPVPGLLAWTGLRHPSLTVTVARPASLVRQLTLDRALQRLLDDPAGVDDPGPVPPP